MSDIEITALEPGHYGVAITEGTTTTHHRVAVPDGLATDVGAPDAEPEVLVRESVEFLLEREPASSILEEFSLNDISRYFPEYPDELRARLAPPGG